jgi:hypothetical protein
MIPPNHKKALQTATVDPKFVIVRTPRKIEVPVNAVKAAVTFAEEELGSATLEYIDNNWYITG